MEDKIRISPWQLIVLILGFMLGIAINPASGAGQDAWLAVILGWLGGMVTFTMYLAIARLNPGRNLVEILQACLGKHLGNLIFIFYIWYFIDLAAIVSRNFAEYAEMTLYDRTPLIFILISSAAVIAYGLRKGLEVLARLDELMIPFVIFIIMLVSIILIPIYQTDNLLPFLNKGWGPVLKATASIFSYPFGELVIFLMIFPVLQPQKKLVRSAYTGIILGGFIYLLITFRDLLTLGPDMFQRIIFPANVSSKLLPFGAFAIDPLFGINILFSGGVKISLCIYAALVGFSQIFNLKEDKILVLPLVAFTTSLAVWLYQNVMQTVDWSADNYFYYAFPFQVIIPGLLLVISFIKKRRQWR